jgi:hypothetical protein
MLQTIDANVTATAPLGKHVSARTSVGGQYNRRSALSNTAAAQQLVPGSGTVAGGATLISREATTEAVVAGTYVEEILGISERLFFTGAMRVDGGSTFGKGFRAAVYPKASVSWLASEEPFWPRLPGVSSLRFRAAYGQSGVQPGAVAAFASEALFTAVVDGSTKPGAGLGALGNRDLRPERQRELETGIDLELLSGRFGVELTYYDKRSTDALVSLPLPSSWGGGKQWRNVGAVRNSGYEALLHATLIERSGLRWAVELNGSINDNRVLAVGPGVDTTFVAFNPSVVRGAPLYSFFDFPILSYDDQNGNGIIEPNEITVGTERRFRGRAYPRTQGSVSTTIGLLGDRLRLSATIDHRGGFVVHNAVEHTRCFLDACLAAADTRASLAAQAAVVASRESRFGSTSWGFIEDGTFTRLREASLNYSLPDRVAHALRVQRAEIMVAGRNLHLWTRYSGVDPEVVSFPGFQSYGAYSDQGGIPPAKSWIVRLKLGM